MCPVSSSLCPPRRAEIADPALGRRPWRTAPAHGVGRDRRDLARDRRRGADADAFPRLLLLDRTDRQRSRRLQPPDRDRVEARAGARLRHCGGVGDLPRASGGRLRSWKDASPNRAPAGAGAAHRDPPYRSPMSRPRPNCTSAATVSHGSGNCCCGCPSCSGVSCSSCSPCSFSSVSQPHLLGTDIGDPASVRLVILAVVNA